MVSEGHLTENVLTDVRDTRHQQPYFHTGMLVVIAFSTASVLVGPQPTPSTHVTYRHLEPLTG